MIPTLIVAHDYAEFVKELLRLVPKDPLQEPATFVMQSDTSLQIDDVRELKKMLSLARTFGTLIIQKADTLTLPAQQAMLKLLEEHGVDHDIFLWVVDVSSMLPTIMSRCRIVRATISGEMEVNSVPNLYNLVIETARTNNSSSLYRGDASKEEVVVMVQKFLTDISYHMKDDHQLVPVSKIALATFQLLTHNNVNHTLALDGMMLRIYRAINKV